MFGFKKSPQRRLEEALKKLESGDVKKALSELSDLAGNKYPEAEFWLGNINEFGFKNLPEAVKWYRCAAEHGHAKSQWCLANMYMTGTGTELNPKEAIRLYHAAAEQQVPEAQFALGEFYRAGQYVKKCPSTALIWYQKAAKAGYEHAETRIQQFWRNGVFQERQVAAKTPDEQPTHDSQVSCESSLSSLTQEIVEAAQQHDYIPAGEIPFVPELRAYQQKIVSFICTYINEDMKTVGLGEAQMVAVFTFVFRRGFDAMYQWHRSTDGRIDDTIMVGNPFNDERFLQLPNDVRREVESIDAPRIVYGIMASWWIQHGDDLRKKGIDIWQPLTLSLSLTFGVAVSIALKMFGYRK